MSAAQGTVAKEPITAEHATALALKSNILELNDALRSGLPEYKTLMQIIHKNTKEIPELAMVLSEEEISVCVAGYIKLTGAIIVAEKVKKVAKSKTPISVADLI